MSEIMEKKVGIVSCSGRSWLKAPLPALPR
jgi:hypothetical protein